MSKRSKRNVGRPRAIGKSAETSARDDILKVSAKLFADKGYKGTSTRAIADQVGMKQPSLFHYFKKKEDILIELVNTGSRGVLAYIEKVDLTHNADLALYLLMLRDCYFLTTEPLTIHSLMSLPEVRNGNLKAIVEGTRQKVTMCYKELVSAGIEQGVFIDLSKDIASHTLIGMSEALWSWYDRDGDCKHARDTAIQIADLALRSILKKPDTIASIRDLALYEIGWMS